MIIFTHNQQNILRCDIKIKYSVFSNTQKFIISLWTWGRIGRGRPKKKSSWMWLRVMWELLVCE